MTTKTSIPTHAVVGAIRAMYHSAGPCHCHDVGKLGEPTTAWVGIEVFVVMDLAPELGPLGRLGDL